MNLYHCPQKYNCIESRNDNGTFFFFLYPTDPQKIYYLIKYVIKKNIIFNFI